MIDVQMMLGSIRFSLLRAAYQELQRATEYRWAAVDAVGVAPTYQFIGVGEETITFSGSVYPHIPTSWGSVEAMRTEANKGKPLTLVDGIGTVYGSYVITAINERQPDHFILGIPRKQEFTMTIKKFKPAGSLLP